jgi:hypothetical protein
MHPFDASKPPDPAVLPPPTKLPQHDRHLMTTSGPHLPLHGTRHSSPGRKIPNAVAPFWAAVPVATSPHVRLYCCRLPPSAVAAASWLVAWGGLAARAPGVRVLFCGDAQMIAMRRALNTQDEVANGASRLMPRTPRHPSPVFCWRRLIASSPHAHNHRRLRHILPAAWSLPPFCCRCRRWWLAAPFAWVRCGACVGAFCFALALQIHKQPMHSHGGETSDTRHLRLRCCSCLHIL